MITVYVFSSSRNQQVAYMAPQTGNLTGRILRWDDLQVAEFVKSFISVPRG
jgi:hypothetical protein